MGCTEYGTMHSNIEPYFSINNENVPMPVSQDTVQGFRGITPFRSIDNIPESCCTKTRKKTYADFEITEQELINKAKTVILGKVVYQCIECNKQLLTRRGYIRHIRIHFNYRPYVCATCDKTFRVKQDLDRHISDVHDGLKKYICDLCDRTFATKHAKDDHRRIHTGDKPYTCEECRKTFRTLNCLYIHNRIHSNYKPYLCETCGKCFRNRQRLKDHTTTHTGVKAFSCELCGKKFSVKSEVVRHCRTHNLEKPFECTVCGMNFGQRRYIRNHIKMHHKEQSNELLARLNVEQH